MSTEMLGHDIAPPAVEVVGMRKQFGPLLALDDVSLTLTPGSFHAVLGENGAGKSTLVKCIMGYYQPDAGRIHLDGREQIIANPREAHALGFGMVYQHFTLVPSMTAAENLLLGLPDLAPILRWDEARAEIDAFMRHMPFQVDLDRPASSLAAGEKQKLEILKQLFLGSRILLLDEPTTVLTPDEADQILGVLRDMTQRKRLTVVIITHKLREGLEFAQEVTVLRAGRRAGGGWVPDLRQDDLVRMMIGSAALAEPAPRLSSPRRAVVLELQEVIARNERGIEAVRGVSLAIHEGEILGVAGVSGNGQRELVEVLAGQRDLESGEIRIHQSAYSRTRPDKLRQRVSVLTEEPLHSACVPSMSVEENLAFCNFDQPATTIGGTFVSRRAIRAQARDLIDRFRIRTQSPAARVDTLSGGNVQRLVLARELSGDVAVLVAQNPCAGLDFTATAEIRGRIMSARNAGAAVLLVSEDLDEILELADRIVVMYEGRLVHETPRDAADVHAIGRAMGSHA